MRILLHDYSGHAFLVQLARQLARDGHEVLHVHFPGFQTPKGVLARRPDDPPGFETRGLRLPGEFAKYSYLKRLGQEFAYGRLLARTIEEWKPEVVLSANSPLDPQHLAWILENLAEGHVVNRIQVPQEDVLPAKQSLDRMLAVV